jgi:hypothetical protein
VLSDPSYRQVACERAAALAGVDGAANAADEVERVLTSTMPTQQLKRALA